MVGGENISEILENLKSGKTPSNVVLLDYVISIQLEKIETNIESKKGNRLSSVSEDAMSNLVALLKLRNKYFKEKNSSKKTKEKDSSKKK